MSELTLVSASDVVPAGTEISLFGGWTWQLQIDLSAAVRKCLTEQPRAVVIDLTGLTDASTAVGPAVLAACRRGERQQPPVPVFVVAPPGAVMQRLRDAGVTRLGNVFESRDAAHLRLAEGIPPVPTARLRLPPDVESPGAARICVGDACLAWDLPQLLHRARWIMSELAMNAVEHARTPFDVVVSLRGPLLHLAVHDGSPALPVLLEEPTERGFGLWFVAAHAAAWGTNPTPTGKIVWTTLRVHPIGARDTVTSW